MNNCYWEEARNVGGKGLLFFFFLVWKWDEQNESMNLTLTIITNRFFYTRRILKLLVHIEELSSIETCFPLLEGIAQASDDNIPVFFSGSIWSEQNASRKILYEAWSYPLGLCLSHSHLSKRSLANNLRTLIKFHGNDEDVMSFVCPNLTDLIFLQHELE